MSQKTLASGDDNITKILLTRAQKQEKKFKKFLEDLAAHFNKAENTAELCCDKLNLYNYDTCDYYYPINIMRIFDMAEFKNEEKVHLKVGPLKNL